MDAQLLELLKSVIPVVGAIAVCMINNHYQMQEIEKKHEANIMLISYRLESLEKTVNKHNNIIERTYELEKGQATMQEQIKVANHRIDDLERGDDRK